MRGHWSDCALHNEPAMPQGPCDCGGFEIGDEVENTTTELRVDRPGALSDFLKKAKQSGG